MRALPARMLSLATGLLALVAAIPLAAQAPTGTVRGVVKNPEGDAVFGASVRIDGTMIGGTADGTGRYVIARVPAGKQTVRVRAIGYRPDSKVVDVPAGGSVEVNFDLASDPMRAEAVVVTGTRSERVTKEATVSAAVIDNVQLTKLAPNFNIADAVRTIPGIHAENGGGELASNVFVRGIPSPGQQRYLMMLENGMPVQSAINLSAEDVLLRQDQNLDRVEVVKGGNSTVFGVSRPGGIINYIDKVGGPTQQNVLQVTTAPSGLYRLDYNSSGPMGDKLTYNVGGFLRLDDGPLQGGLPTQGMQFKANVTRMLEKGYVRAHLKIIDDKVQFFLPVPYAKGADVAAVGRAGTLNTPEAANLIVSGFTGGFFNGTFQSKMANGILVRGPVATLEFSNEVAPGWQLTSRTRMSNIAHEFNIFLPGSNTNTAAGFAAQYLTNPAWRPVYSYVNNAVVPFNSANVMTQDARYRNRPFTEYANETQLQRKIVQGQTQHSLTLGSFLSRTRQLDQQFSPLTLIDVQSQPRLLDLTIRGGPAGSAGDTVVRRITQNGLTRLSSAYTNAEYQTGIAAFFAGDEMQIGTKWRVDLGARYERQNTSISQEQTANQTVGITEAGRNVAIGTGRFVRRVVKFDDWAATGGVNYAINATSNFYVSGSRGFRIPDASFFTSLALDANGNFRQPQLTKNEQFLQGEVGYRLTTKQAGLTVAPFYVNIKNRLQSDLRILPGGVSAVVTDAVGETRTAGVEATLVATPSALPGWTFQAAGTYQDHKALNFPQVPTIYLRDANGAIRDSVTSNSGRKIRRQPNTMADLSANYQRRGLDANFDYNYIGSRFADDANLQKLEGFGVLTAGAGYTFGRNTAQRIRVGVNIYNLLDDRGVTEGDPRLAGGVDPSTLPFLNFRPILPRRVMVSLRYDF